MKKLISVILSMSIILSACNLNAFAEITPYECRLISGCNVYDGGDFDPNYDVTLFSVSQKDQFFDAADRRAAKDIPKLERASDILGVVQPFVTMIISGFLGVGVKNLCQRLIKKFKISKQSKNFEELLSNEPDSEEKTLILDTISGLKKLTKTKDKEQFTAELEKLKDLSGSDSEKLNIVKKLESLKEENTDKDLQLAYNALTMVLSSPILLFAFLFTDMQLQEKGYEPILMSLPFKLSDKATSYIFLQKDRLNSSWNSDIQKKIDEKKRKKYKRCKNCKPVNLTDDNLYVALVNSRKGYFYLESPTY